MGGAATKTKTDGHMKRQPLTLFYSPARQDHAAVATAEGKAWAKMQKSYEEIGVQGYINPASNSDILSKAKVQAGSSVTLSPLADDLLDKIDDIVEKIKDNMEEQQELLGRTR